MQIPYWAGHYIGLPFLEHGRSIRGLDCWGLVRLVLHEQFDVCLPSYIRECTHTYHKRDIGRLIRHESRKWSLVPAGQEQCGDGCGFAHCTNLSICMAKIQSKPNIRSIRTMFYGLSFASKF